MLQSKFVSETNMYQELGKQSQNKLCEGTHPPYTDSNNSQQRLRDEGSVGPLTDKQTNQGP